MLDTEPGILGARFRESPLHRVQHHTVRAISDRVRRDLETRFDAATDGLVHLVLAEAKDALVVGIVVIGLEKCGPS